MFFEKIADELEDMALARRQTVAETRTHLSERLF